MVYLEFTKIAINQKSKGKDSPALWKCRPQKAGEKLLLNYYDIVSFEQCSKPDCTIITLRNGNVYAVTDNYTNIREVLRRSANIEI